MENESTEGRTLSLDLPPALAEWLTERADELGVDESELLVQLIGSYRVAADAEDSTAVNLADTLPEGDTDLETAVRETVDEAVAEVAPDEDAVAGRVEDRLASRLDGIEAEFDEKLTDVRRRVVQVKQEVDAKAPGDHDHDEFERLDGLAAAVEELEETVDESESESEVDAELAGQVDDIRNKLTQLARVVVRLRDEVDEDPAEDDEALTEIRRMAAREGYEKAVCGACDETVHVGLLPEAKCPHCRSPFSGFVEGSGWLFTPKPRLVGPHEHRDAGRDDEGPDTMSSVVPDEETDGGEDIGSPVSADGGTNE